MDHVMPSAGPGEASVVDPGRVEAFAGRMVEMFNGAGLMLMISLGHRTGLFDAMEGLPASTSAQIADRAGLSERYVREWLGAMTTGGIVDHQPDEACLAAGTYRLPPEHAALLTRAASPENLAAMAQWVGVLGGVEDEVAEAFKHGRGVPYSAYKRFHEVMAAESDQLVVAALGDHILPLVPGLIDRMERGIDVLDVGCGSGRAMCELARRYPCSRFVGYDFAAAAVDAARAQADRQGLTNARFEQRDAAAIDDAQRFDAVFTFDAIHDQADPQRVLDNIHRALRPGGVYLMQDIKAHTPHHLNHDQPIAPFIYTISTMHCMSVSLANGGPGLGAAWGKELALEMLAAAGFDAVRVEELAHDMQNYYYIMTSAD